jgi:hypothetical protein
MNWLKRLRAHRCGKGKHVLGPRVYGNRMVCRHCKNIVEDLK